MFSWWVSYGFVESVIILWHCYVIFLSFLCKEIYLINSYVMKNVLLFFADTFVCKSGDIGHSLVDRIDNPSLIPFSTFVYNICVQHLCTISVYHICVQHLCSAYVYNICVQHMCTTSLYKICVQHLCTASVCGTSTLFKPKWQK